MYVPFLSHFSLFYLIFLARQTCSIGICYFSVAVDNFHRHVSVNSKPGSVLIYFSYSCRKISDLICCFLKKWVTVRRILNLMSSMKQGSRKHLQDKLNPIMISFESINLQSTFGFIPTSGTFKAVA